MLLRAMMRCIFAAAYERRLLMMRELFVSPPLCHGIAAIDVAYFALRARCARLLMLLLLLMMFHF